jgi:hypothetical protein
MLLADAGDLAFQQRLCRRKACLGLPGGEHGVDAGAVQLQHLAALRLPFRDRLVELGIDSGSFGKLALERQDGPELSQGVGAVLGIVADIQGAVDFEGGTRQFLGLIVAAFLDQNIGKSFDISRGLRIVFALGFQPRLQRAPHIDFGFREPALLRLHAPDVEKVGVQSPTHLRFGRPMRDGFHIGD